MKLFERNFLQSPCVNHKSHIQWIYIFHLVLCEAYSTPILRQNGTL